MSNIHISSALPARDHGGGLDAAVARYGGSRNQWLDLSTGINPRPYRIGAFADTDWTDLPDKGALTRLETAARRFWRVPDTAQVLAAPGASSLIARIPALSPPATVKITKPTYNEHAAAFEANGWQVVPDGRAQARVIVHPNNPDGRLWSANDASAALTIIDESFCDVTPEHTLIRLAANPGVVVLKSFGKFWGLAGLRLGFAIGCSDAISRLAEFIGPWAVSGPAMRIGALALENPAWADDTRARLKIDAARLDDLMTQNGAVTSGGTDLFRLYEVDNASRWQDRLARRYIWTRVFPYSSRLIRLGLPDGDGWDQLREAL